MNEQYSWTVKAPCWLLVAVVSLSAGCSKGGADIDVLTVGAFFSLSGADSAFGNDSREGIEMATDEINAAGGVKGKKIRVLMEDDKSNNQETSNMVHQLIDRDKVIAILGEVASARSLAGGLVANDKHIPMISPSSTNVEVTQGREYVFRVCFTDDYQGKSAARFVVDKLGKKKIAILYLAQDTYSSGLSSSFREAAAKLGATIVAEKGYPKGETSFTTYLNEIKAANPEVIYTPVYYSDMVPIARQAKAVGIPGSIFVGGDGWDSEELLKGAAAELEGAYLTNHYAPDVPWPNTQAFVKNYQQRFHREPTSVAAQAYDAARLLYDAMSRATGIAPDPIRDAIGATKGFQGATGTISIDQNRNAQKPVVVEQIKNGKFTYSSTAGG
ncbi:MAG TPA: ABC transporter substrate-binding protein [Polyangiaceae bacterium]|jgi:branched-chain amino acid transport system substrate-binding protein|nr:ABC transporter substrate-binding protein [Polyangiaceae bacterium]